jgi:hypothetical protein
MSHELLCVQIHILGILSSFHQYMVEPIGKAEALANKSTKPVVVEHFALYGVRGDTMPLLVSGPLFGGSDTAPTAGWQS